MDTLTDRPTGHRRRRRSTRLSDNERAAVGALAAAVAFVALVAPAPGTHATIADPVWAAVLATIVVVGAARARPWSLVWLARISMAASIGSPWAISAGVAVCLCAVAISSNRRLPAVNAAVGGAAVLALLHLPDLAFFGFPSLVAATALAPVLWSGYKNLPRAWRR